MATGGVQARFMYFAGLCVGFPLSVLALKLALAKQLQTPPDWIAALSYWWSFFWRVCLYGAAVGFIAGLFVAIFLGRPMDHPEGFWLSWLVTLGPASIFALRQVLKKHCNVPASSS